MNTISEQIKDYLPLVLLLVITFSGVWHMISVILTSFLRKRIRLITTYLKKNGDMNYIFLHEIVSLLPNKFKNVYINSFKGFRFDDSGTWFELRFDISQDELLVKIYANELKYAYKCDSKTRLAYIINKIMLETEDEKLKNAMLKINNMIDIKDLGVAMSGTINLPNLYTSIKGQNVTSIKYDPNDGVTEVQLNNNTVAKYECLCKNDKDIINEKFGPSKTYFSNPF